RDDNTWAAVPSGGGGGAFRNYSSRSGQLPGGHLRSGYSAEATDAGKIYGTPFLLTTAATLMTVSLSVTTAAATAGSLARFAVWAANGPEGSGASLVLDAGTVAIDSTGVKSATGLTTPLPAG